MKKKEKNKIKDRQNPNPRTQIADEKTIKKESDKFIEIAKHVVKGLRQGGYISYDVEKEIIQGLDENTPLLPKLTEKRIRNLDKEEDLVNYVLSYHGPQDLTMEEMAHEIFTNGRPFGKTFEELGYSEAWVYNIMDQVVEAILDDVKSGKMSWEEVERRANRKNKTKEYSKNVEVA